MAIQNLYANIGADNYDSSEDFWKVIEHKDGTYDISEDDSQDITVVNENGKVTRKYDYRGGDESDFLQAALGIDEEQADYLVDNRQTISNVALNNVKLNNAVRPFSSDYSLRGLFLVIDVVNVCDNLFVNQLVSGAAELLNMGSNVANTLLDGVNTVYEGLWDAAYELADNYNDAVPYEWMTVDVDYIRQPLENDPLTMMFTMQAANEIKAMQSYARTIDTALMLETETTSGVVLKSTPGRTTTVLGRFNSDTGRIIKELQLPKSVDFSGNPSGFNLLYIPDDLYRTADQFWFDYNKPFLDAAIQRNDVFLMATPLNTVPKDSAYYREFMYLLENGYEFRDNKMIKFY